MDLSSSFMGPIASLYDHNNKPSLSIIGEKFLYELRDYHFHKKGLSSMEFYNSNSCLFLCRNILSPENYV